MVPFTISRFMQERGDESSLLHTRIEVCPPGRRGSTGNRSGWRAWLARWWTGATDLATHRQSSKAYSADLAAVQRDFIAVLADVRTRAAGDLLGRIRLSHSRQELWHLRSDVFSLLAQHHDQALAGDRMATLNRHFPTRAPRSGLMPLERPARPGS